MWVTALSLLPVLTSLTLNDRHQSPSRRGLTTREDHSGTRVLPREGLCEAGSPGVVAGEEGGGAVHPPSALRTVCRSSCAPKALMVSRQLQILR